MKKLLWTFVLATVVIVTPQVLPSNCLAAEDNGSQSISLRQGWDDFTFPLRKGKVIFNQPESGMFQVTYILIGAKPNWVYQVGIHLFPSGNQWDDFGSEGWEDNPRDDEYICRENNCSQVNAWEFGFLTTDGDGDGAAHFNLHPKSGMYKMQFSVRKGACIGIAQGVVVPEGAIWSCDVVFESGGPFTTAVPVIVP